MKMLLTKEKPVEPEMGDEKWNKLQQQKLVANKKKSTKYILISIHTQEKWKENKIMKGKTNI